MVDHSENNLFEIDLELRERGHSGLLVPVIADCKDASAMERLFASERPEIVFHAAAYKHVPMMELNPVQAIANNALATAVLADLAERFAVERFAHLHRQGRRAEDRHGRLQGSCGAGRRGARRRPGHPLCGRALRQRPRQLRLGALIFRRQIAEGGPVTVTHPEMTRFFMTIPEAVQLVIEATGIAEGGDIFVLDMGEPVRIMDLARRTIELAGQDVAIEIVGIRPGEKLHEELFNVDEEVRPTRYGKIMRATRPPLDPRS